ncbi:MAG: amidohydrolase family protein [Actinomyces sp.]|jgi:N-acetylglucosamine-6-phosphate deacetylase|nr:amidohydrolase family protein [Actinomyces sp.]MCI1661350.1 amidohydrolase family protein [Actinomyces sp.]MCI1866610.1 amidohydrolase family protein [Actinomyces sp.]
METKRIVVRGRTVLDDSVAEDGAVVLRGDRILWAGAVADAGSAGEDVARAVRSAPQSRRTVIPGLVDVHCHGGGGASFPNAETAEEAMAAVLEHRRHGTTSLVGSCVTAAPEVLLARAQMMSGLARRGELAGIHFEGPFVSRERCGAQDPAFIVDPDAGLTRALLDAAGGHAVTMTLAPEKPGAFGPGSVAEVLIEEGALPSWGHTDSAPGSARAALEYSREKLEAQGEAGRRSARATVTHLFNGMRPLHHRDPGPIAEFVSDAARGGAIVEMICDGVHLAPSLVRDVYETVGRDGCVFVTDAMAAAGMADGRYQLGPQAVTVTDGVARLSEGGSIAGGTAHLLDCVRVAVQQAGIPLADAVHMASAQGADILGDPRVGRLAAGAFADLVETDEDLRAVRVWRRGEPVD